MPGDALRVSVEREGREIWLSFRTPDGRSATLRARPRAHAPLALCLLHLCTDDTDASTEFQMRAELELCAGKPDREPNP